MDNVLAKICAKKQEHIAQCKRNMPLALLEDKLVTAPVLRGFKSAIDLKINKGDIALIAEIKKASPSKGLIREDFDPEILAKAYREAGATCLSVLTDVPYFQGNDAYLRLVRDTVDLPLLRKDFMLDPYQVVEARLLGADCILLIMAALTDEKAALLEKKAQELGMDVLVEVHDFIELERALKLQSRLIGINNRNLKTMQVSLDVTRVLSTKVPSGYTLVCESGIVTHDDVASMGRSGIFSFLVGESLMRQENVCEATKKLIGKN